MNRLRLVVLIVMALCRGAMGQIVVPGADGSDGVFNPTGNVVVNLALAPTGVWDGPNAQPGQGVYDPQKWAVVFRYSSINIPAGVTVSFSNHPAFAPVVWLVSGNVTINGTISLNGQNGSTSPNVLPVPGPGGFHGARVFQSAQSVASAGRGPGGGPYSGSGSGPNVGGSHGTQGSGGGAGSTYGNASVLPLMGGSGGSPGVGSGLGCNGESVGGGAGGGSILIATQNTTSISGLINALGGNPPSSCSGAGGSGGAIRIISDVVSGTGGLRARGGIAAISPGGAGRIRVEGNSITLSDPGNPAFSPGVAGATAVIWPATSAPSIVISSVGGQPVPVDPRASLDFGSQDVGLNNPNPVTVQIQATNVPTSWSMVVRVVPKQGAAQNVNATRISGGFASSIWEASLSLPNGFSNMQVRASQ